MTYFSIIPESMKQRKLKIAIVFLHDAFRFEVWLSGSNRSVQSKYWKILQEYNWDQYHLSSNPKAEDYVIGHILTSDPDFGHMAKLTEEIERGTLKFIGDIEGFFSRNSI